MNPVIAIDPGREKCGVAVLAQNREILRKKVIDTAALVAAVKALADEFDSATILLGNGTSSGSARAALALAFQEDKIKLQIVDEYRSTDAAKIRYWEDHPPRGWRRLIPVSMQVPPEPVDDYVAVLLAERYLAFFSDCKTISSD